MVRATSRHILLVLVLCLCGCAPRVILSETDGDRLRARAVELEDRVSQLERRNAELEAELDRQVAAAPAGTEEIRASTPHAASISIDRLSAARDTDGDGTADEVVLYIEPVDGRGRFVQVVGTLSVNVATLPAAADAVTIGRASLSPAQVREAYRSSFMGTHYTLTVPIAGTAETSCVARVVLADALTGRELATERTIPLEP